MDGTIRNVNLMEQVGITVLVERQMKGQDVADDSNTLSGTLGSQSEGLKRLDNIKICTIRAASC
jgi:hypothetical protein